MSRLLDYLDALPHYLTHNALANARMPGLGQWLLETPEFIQWKQGNIPNNTLWLRGVPGAGKTYLA